jgi:uncharacterized membrane protein YgcG
VSRVTRLLALLLAALALCLPGAASADERILAWHSDIAIQPDSSLDVTETLRVRSEGDQIQHGILRDFPTLYRRDGRRVRAGFDVDSVERDGHAEPYDTEGITGGVRLKIGDADSYLDPGEHTYVIRYTTTRQLGFYDGFDELYWNVTGNGWEFPIDSAEAHITLPKPVPFGPERVFYTGPQGATEHNAEVVSESAGDITVRTTAPLGPYEGFTVAVRWPKGIVAEPPKPSAARAALQDQVPIAAALAALLGLAVYFFYAWKRAGRGPRAGTIVPLFTPPDNLSAPALRFIKRMGFDDRCFAAAIVESGVHRELKIVESQEGFLHGKKSSLTKTTGKADLPAAESAMLGELFQGSDTIEMVSENHERFSAARTALQEGLTEAYEKANFVKNLAWAWGGLALLLAALALVASAVAFSDFYTTASERMVPALGLALIVAGLLLVFRHRRGWVLPVLIVALILLGVFLSGVAFIRLASEEPFSVWGWMLAPLLALPVVISAFVWMSAPTRQGRALMDRIAGFEQYLSITEEDRLEAMHPPDKTPELFERYLPHAIALGVENHWADKFASVLAAVEADPSRQGSSFGWYSGSSNVWSNPGRFAGAVGASLASSVSSASTAPGSGGGGSSGGGGGGGGGGGW